MQPSTTTEPITPAEHPSLTRLASRAVAQARALGRPILVSYAFPLPRLDLLGLARRMDGAGGFRCYWERPGDGFALAAGGTALRFRSEGPRRFAGMDEVVQAALADAEEGAEPGCESPGPYFLGGFSFFDALDAEQWPGFGPAQLVVPAWLAIGSPNGATGVVSARVAPEDGAAPAAQALAASIDRLRAAAGLVAHAPGPNGEHPANGGAPAFRREARSDERQAWLEIVRRARDAIRGGRLAKVVLARALDLVCEAPPSPYALLGRLREAYPDCYSFLFDPGEGQVFLGATPERLARFAGNTVRMGALAGTVPRGTTPEADRAHARHLLDSAKEREEHRIVVDGIVAAAAAFGQVSRPPEPELLRLNNLQHLFTPITLQAERPVPALTLLERLHPTPAVGGLPREEAFRLIRDSEHFDRGWYASPVGWMNARGEGEFAVALRSGAICGNRLRLFAGGGIVADSDPEREFEETQIKFQPLLTALVNE